MSIVRLVWNDAENKNNLICKDHHSSWYNNFYDNFFLYGMFKHALHFSVDDLPSELFIFDLQYPIEYLGDMDLYNLSSDKHLLGINYVPAPVMLRVKNKSAYLCINLGTEAFLDHNLLTVMSEYFMHFEIPLDRVLYVTNAANGEKILHDHKEDMNYKSCMKHVYYPFFIDNYSYRFPRDVDYVTTNNSIEKDFLCFNYNHHCHRLLNYFLMHKTNLIKHSFFSLPKDGYRDNIKESLCTELGDAIWQDLELLENEVDYALSDLPLKIEKDFTRKDINTSPILPELFKKSMLSVITETNFYQEAIHVTEKTYKAISFEHPFILLASAGTLQYLRYLGFMTFDAWWDESYDKITDPTERLLKINQVIKEIHDWPIGKKLSFINEVKPATQHNKILIDTMKKQHHVYSNLKDHV